MRVLIEETNSMADTNLSNSDTDIYRINGRFHRFDPQEKRFIPVSAADQKALDEIKYRQEYEEMIANLSKDKYDQMIKDNENKWKLFHAQSNDPDKTTNFRDSSVNNWFISKKKSEEARNTRRAFVNMTKLHTGSMDSVVEQFRAAFAEKVLKNQIHASTKPVWGRDEETREFQEVPHGMPNVNRMYISGYNYIDQKHNSKRPLILVYQDRSASFDEKKAEFADKLMQTIDKYQGKFDIQYYAFADYLSKPLSSIKDKTPNLGWGTNVDNVIDDVSNQASGRGRDPRAMSPQDQGSNIDPVLNSITAYSAQISQMRPVNVVIITDGDPSWAAHKRVTMHKGSVWLMFTGENDGGKLFDLFGGNDFSCQSTRLVSQYEFIE